MWGIIIVGGLAAGLMVAASRGVFQDVLEQLAQCEPVVYDPYDLRRIHIPTVAVLPDAAHDLI